jgi:glutamine amidotransferase
VDYGVGNVASVANILWALGVDVNFANTSAEISKARKIILPGVGSFDRAMRHVVELDLREPLREAALQDRKPFLGICLGMQLLFENSEEGRLPGLGLIEGVVRRLDPSMGRVPNMGWRRLVLPVESDDQQFAFLESERFYFAHSYSAHPTEQSQVVAFTGENHPAVAVVKNENILGVQFHPEKSLDQGKNFLAYFAQFENRG